MSQVTARAVLAGYLPPPTDRGRPPNLRQLDRELARAGVSPRVRWQWYGQLPAAWGGPARRVLVVRQMLVGSDYASPPGTFARLRELGTTLGLTPTVELVTLPETLQSHLWRGVRRHAERNRA